MSEILISVARIAISGFYYRFLRGRIKSWWDHRKVLKRIMERIEELCEERVGGEFSAVLKEISMPEDFIEKRLKEERKRIKKYNSITLWMEHVTHLKAFITNLFKLYEIELDQLYQQQFTDNARKLLTDIPNQVEDVLLELKPNKLIIQIFKKVGDIEKKLNSAIETATNQENYDQLESLFDQELKNLYDAINTISNSQGTALQEIENLKLQLQAFRASELHNNIFEIKNLFSEGLNHIYRIITEVSESPEVLLEQILDNLNSHSQGLSDVLDELKNISERLTGIERIVSISVPSRDKATLQRQVVYNTCEKCDEKFPNDFLTKLRNEGKYVCPKCGAVFPGLTTFLSGTSKVTHVFERVSEKLKKNGYKISWYLDEFRAMSNNVLDDCFQNLKKSDRVIIVIGKDYGSEYYDTGHSITEEEWRQALKQENRLLIFVEGDVFEEYKRLDKIIEPEYDLRIHKFIQETLENRKNWVFKFDYIDDIITKVLSSWGSFVEKVKIDPSRLKEPTYLYEGERFESSIKKPRSPVIRSYPIETLEDLETLWKNRNKYLRESNPRGVMTLQDFWEQQCSEEAWYPTPNEFVNMWENNNVWLITAAPGNGKTMFLLTIAKNLIKKYDDNPPKMVFFQPWAFLDIREFEEFSNHIVFVDLPPTSNIDILINSICVGVKKGCTFIITLYSEDAEKVHGRLLKKDIHLGELLKIDEGPDRAHRLNLTIDKILKGWNISTKSFPDNDEAKNMILNKMGFFEGLKRVQYELLFFSHNLISFKDNKLTPDDIEDFIEPTNFAYRTLRQIIKDEDAINFIRGFDLLLRYMDSLENGFRHLELIDIPIFVHKDGVVQIISEFKHIPNFRKALKNARILESINGDFMIFDKMGFGGRVFEEYRSHFKDSYDYNETELEHIENSLINHIQEQEETDNYISGMLLDLLRLIISKGLPRKMLFSTVNKLKSFSQDSYAYKETIKLLLFYGASLILDDILRAIEYFEYLSKLEPINPVVWFYLGIALNQNGDLNGAIKALRKTVQFDPDFMIAWQYLGDSFKARGELEEAIKSYKKGLELFPDNPDIWLNLGIALENKDEFEEAINAYKKGLEITPNDKWLLYNLGNVFIKTENPDDAVTAYRKAHMIDPKNPAILGNLGAALHEIGNIDDAITAFKNVIEKNPRDVNALNNLGVVLGDKGENEEAVEVYSKALEIDPHKTSVWKNLGFLYFNLGNNHGAIDAYRRALELNPIDSKIWSNLAGALYKNGDFSESVNACKKSIEIDPTNAEVQFNLGTTLNEIGNIDKAIDAYKTGLKINSNYPEVWHSLGLALNNKGDLDDAINAYKKSLELDSQNAKLWNNLGFALDNKGDLKGGIEAYEKSIEIDSKLTSVWINFGNSLFKQNNINKAIWAYNRALKLEPNNEKAKLNLSIALKNKIDPLRTTRTREDRPIVRMPKFVSKVKDKHKGRSAEKWSDKAWFFYDRQFYSRAKDCWERAVKVDPQYLFGWIYLGAVLVKLRELEKAEECFKKALKIDPKNSYTLLLLGQLYFEQGNLKTAQNVLMKASKSNPYDKLVWRQLGFIQEELGNLESAYKYFHKILEIDPTDIEGLIKLGNLYFNEENFEDAKKFLDKAFEELIKNREFNPDQVENLTILSLCFYGMGEFSRVKECLKKIKEIDINTTFTWEKLESIFKNGIDKVNL